MNKEQKRVIFILTCIIIMFLSLIVYLTWFQVFRADLVKVNNYNKRQWLNEERILRGSIWDRNGVELAHSERLEEGSKRIYNYSNLYSHIIGYSYREYGKTGLELKYNNSLLGIEEGSPINDIKNILETEKSGYGLRTSLDHNMQLKTKELMAGRTGAVITMDPRTGEIYSMVSLPDFDVSNLNFNWQNITDSSQGILVNRASQGLYEPGSSFKILTAASILENNMLGANYECKGSTVIDGYRFKDYNEKAHGNVDLKMALTKSCNTYFVEKAHELGRERLGSTGDKFYLNKEIPFDLATNKSIFNYRDNIGKTELAASGIGQGKVQVTPLNMAIITSAIANDGNMMKPKLVKEIIDKDGTIKEELGTKQLAQPISPATASYLKDSMENVVASGTGQNARIPGVRVAGKTGTAENASGKSHAWFVGFAPVDDPKVVTVVVLEEAGSTGGKLAAPIAKELMEYAINNIN